MQIEQDDYMQGQTKQKSKNTGKIIAILIVVMVLVIIAIIVAIMSLTGTGLTVTIDGVKTSVADDVFLVTDSGEVYVSIKDIATYVGYEAHNGEYKVDSEDTNKMYVEATDGTETTSFFLNSTIISKVEPDSTEDYENIQIDEPVISQNDKLYVSAEGFIIGFNSLLQYNQESNTIVIQTLPYLVSYYETVITDYGYDALSDDFNNQKALIYGMIVASKSSTGKYGVINTSGVEIISPRYNEIEFVESIGEFIITNSSNKVGIAYSTGETKITVSYDSIKVIDATNSLYLVESNNKFGVIDEEETLIVHIEYDQIGISSSDFVSDNITNQYILFDSLIPVELNGKWGFFDTNGNQITQVEFDAVGSDNSNLSDKVVNNAAVISDDKVVIVGKDDKYGAIDVKGNYIIPISFDYIYSVTSNGETTYYIVYDGVDYSATEYIAAIRQIYGLDENGDAITEEQTEETSADTSEDGTVADTSETEENTSTEENINVEETENIEEDVTEVENPTE